VDVLKPSFCGDQLDDLLHTDNVRLIYLTNDHRLEATGGSLDDRDSIGGELLCSHFPTLAPWLDPEQRGLSPVANPRHNQRAARTSWGTLQRRDAWMPGYAIPLISAA